MKKTNRFGAAVLVFAAAGGMAEAQRAPQRGAANPTAGTFELGKYGDWGAYKSGTGGTLVCFALSQPKDRVPKGLNRDPAYVFISSRPGQNVRNEVSFIMGFAVKGGSDASAAVDTARFTLEGKDKTAFVKNPADEARVIEALKGGSRLTVKATSLRGNDTTDTYSLAGLAKALEKLTSDCK